MTIDRPNGVSSRAADPRRAVAPLAYEGAPAQVRARLRAVVAALPRTRVVEQSACRWALECRSRLFGFVDDLVFEFDDEAHVVHVTSRARTGYWDMGVNRHRVEAIRRELSARRSEEQTEGGHSGGTTANS